MPHSRHINLAVRSLGGAHDLGAQFELQPLLLENSLEVLGDLHVDAHSTDVAKELHCCNLGTKPLPNGPLGTNRMDLHNQTQFRSIISPQMLQTCTFMNKMNNLDQSYDDYGMKFCNIHTITFQSSTHQLHANDSCSNHNELLWNFFEGQSASGRNNTVFINLLQGNNISDLIFMI